MENKYYTPQIEEFCVGIEYETKISSNHDEWMVVKIVSPNQTQSLNGTYKDDWELELVRVDETRVKYLDKEDIESLGWSLEAIGAQGISLHDSEKYKMFCDYLRGRVKCEMIYNLHSKWVLITIDSKTIFAGFIKNKSELIKLMKQLGING